MPEEVDKFVVASSMYHDIQIRVTFLEKQTCNDEFKILSRYYLINTEDRKKLATSRVETENIIYYNGMTSRKVGHMPTPKIQVSPWTENKIE